MGLEVFRGHSQQLGQPLEIMVLQEWLLDGRNEREQGIAKLPFALWRIGVETLRQRLKQVVHQWLRPIDQGGPLLGVVPD